MLPVQILGALMNDIRLSDPQTFAEHGESGEFLVAFEGAAPAPPEQEQLSASFEFSLIWSNAPLEEARIDLPDAQVENQPDVLVAEPLSFTIDGPDDHADVAGKEGTEFKGTLLGIPSAPPLGIGALEGSVEQSSKPAAVTTTHPNPPEQTFPVQVPTPTTPDTNPSVRIEMPKGPLNDISAIPIDDAAQKTAPLSAALLTNALGDIAPQNDSASHPVSAPVAPRMQASPSILNPIPQMPHPEAGMGNGPTQDSAISAPIQTGPQALPHMVATKTDTDPKARITPNKMPDVPLQSQDIAVAPTFRPAKLPDQRVETPQAVASPRTRTTDQGLLSPQAVTIPLKLTQTPETDVLAPSKLEPRTDIAEAKPMLPTRDTKSEDIVSPDAPRPSPLAESAAKTGGLGAVSPPVFKLETGNALPEVAPLDAVSLVSQPSTTASSSALTSLPSAQPATAAQIISQIVSSVVPNGAQPAVEQITEIALDPPELGRVRMILSQSDTGQIAMTVIADRPETLDLLRRNGDLLAHEFARSGLEGSEFAFQDGQKDGPANQTPSDESAATSVPSEIGQTPVSQTTPRKTNGLDLRL